MSDNGKIKYTIDAEDRMSDVLGRVNQSYSSLTGAIKSTYGALRSGGVRGAVEHFKNLRVGGMANTGMFKMLVGAINPVTLALGIATVAAKVFRDAMAKIRESIGQAVEFQKHTFDLKALEGSYIRARQTMLSLTEGKQAVDHEFGTDAVVKAYKNLHTYSDGALASANMVSLLGNRAKFTGKSIQEMSEVAGKAWQAISQGNGLRMAREQLISTMRIDSSVIKELEDMQKAGASAGDVWLRLRDELQKTSNTIEDSKGSIDDLNKRIKDAKGTIGTAFGELFAPMVKGWKSAEVAILDGFAKILGRGKEVREELAEQARAREADEMNRKQAEELEKKWGEARGRQTQRREDERFSAMPVWQIGQEAEKAEREGRVDDWEKLTQLREKKLAEALTAQAKKEEEQQKAVADARKQQADAELTAIEEARKLAEEQAAAAAAAADALASRKDQLGLAGMSGEDRAAEYERRAAAQAAEAAGIRSGRTDDKLSSVELAAVLKAELQALNMGELAKGERSTIAEQEARDAEAKARQRISIKEALAAAQANLAGMSGASTANIDIAARTEWMRNVGAGRSPDEQIADNTRAMREALEEIRKQKAGIL
jgi:hypothetical protein